MKREQTSPAPAAPVVALPIRYCGKCGASFRQFLACTDDGCVLVAAPERGAPEPWR